MKYYGVYGGYRRNVGQSFYEQVMSRAAPRDEKVYTWSVSLALREMQEYRQHGFDYVMLMPFEQEMP